MYQLHYCPGTASLVAHWLLIEMELPHELFMVDFSKNQQKSPEYLNVNPSGLVPTLIIDGKPMSEFAAICMYLADKYPEKKLAPALDSPDRPKYNQWMFYFSNTIQPIFRLWFYPQDIIDNEELIRGKVQQKIESYFERLNKEFADGRKYILGDQISAADFCLTMLMRWSRNMPKPADTWPHLLNFAKRMKSLPSFKEVYRREGITDWT